MYLLSLHLEHILAKSRHLMPTAKDSEPSSYMSEKPLLTIGVTLFYEQGQVKCKQSHLAYREYTHLLFALQMG